MLISPTTNSTRWMKTALISAAVMISAVGAVVFDHFHLQHEKMRWRTMHPGVHGYWQASCLETLLTDNGRPYPGTKRLLDFLSIEEAEH